MAHSANAYPSTPCHSLSILNASAHDFGERGFVQQVTRPDPALRDLVPWYRTTECLTPAETTSTVRTHPPPWAAPAIALHSATTTNSSESCAFRWRQQRIAETGERFQRVDSPRSDHGNPLVFFETLETPTMLYCDGHTPRGSPDARLRVMLVLKDSTLYIGLLASLLSPHGYDERRDASRHSALASIESSLASSISQLSIYRIVTVPFAIRHSSTTI